jgi:hypothetical protein
MEQIKVEYGGVDELSVDASGRLVARTGWGDMIAAIGPPVDGGVSSTIGLLLFPENTAGFDVSGKQTRQSTSLAVTLDYSTYLGGSSDDGGMAIAVDGIGCAYVAGATWSTDFPTVDPFQTYQVSQTGFVTKLSASGSSLEYSTYLGGNDAENIVGITVDGSGCAYVSGYTYSTDFPMENPYQTDESFGEAFVTKLSAAGNSLIYSTYLGGSQWDIGTTMPTWWATHSPATFQLRTRTRHIKLVLMHLSRS